MSSDEYKRGGSAASSGSPNNARGPFLNEPRGRALRKARRAIYFVDRPHLTVTEDGLRVHVGLKNDSSFDFGFRFDVKLNGDWIPDGSPSAFAATSTTTASRSRSRCTSRSTSIRRRRPSN